MCRMTCECADLTEGTVALTLNDHHELDTDVKNCVHLGKSVGMDSCILLASEHSEPLWHRIS